MIQPIKTDNPVTNLLNAVVEQAIIDYLMAKLYLHRLERNEPKILGTVKRIEMTKEDFKIQCEETIDECVEFFREGIFKVLYNNLTGDEVIAALDARFTNEVIPEYERTGIWTFKRLAEAESE